MNDIKITTGGLGEIYQPVHTEVLEYVTDSTVCLVCSVNIEQKQIFRIETTFEGDIGAFCSKGCASVMAGCISHATPLAYKPKINIMPLCMYKNSTKLLDALRKEKEECYGSQERHINGKVRVILKRINIDYS